MKLRLTSYLIIAMLLCLCGANAADSKPGSQKTKKAAPAKTVNRKAAKKKPAARQRARRRPVRQTSPTPERYKQFQQALADQGYYAGEINGRWGPESIAALKKFQEEHDLTVDGKLGALSIIALGLGPKHESGNDLAGKPEPIE